MLEPVSTVNLRGLASVTSDVEFDRDPELIEFRFSSGHFLRLRIVQDDDSIDFSIVSDGRGAPVELESQAELLELIGSDLLWVWTLTNHKGYTDGVQISFWSEQDKVERIVQLLVVASSFRLFLLTRLAL